MKAIDRAGIFKVKPLSWIVRKSEKSKAVAISFRFAVLEMLLDGAWHDWTQYGEFCVFGDWYVVKKDGGVNQKPVEQLATSLGWKGSLGQVVNQPPPDVVVQVRVEENTHEGKTSYPATWMNPGDYDPAPQGVDDAGVRELDALFGSQLRAIAMAGKTPKPAAKPAAPPPPKASGAAPIGAEADENAPPAEWEKPMTDEEKAADARARQ